MLPKASAARRRWLAVAAPGEGHGVPAEARADAAGADADLGPGAAAVGALPGAVVASQAADEDVGGVVGIDADGVVVPAEAAHETAAAAGQVAGDVAP